VPSISKNLRNALLLASSTACNSQQTVTLPSTGCNVTLLHLQNSETADTASLLADSASIQDFHSAFYYFSSQRLLLIVFVFFVNTKLLIIWSLFLFS
jgi:hypothetical protein